MADCAPIFSVIVPTRGRPAQLQSCLESLRALTFSPEDFEIIVVDDGSPTALDEIVGPARVSRKVVLLRKTHSGPASARNAGVKVARGRFIAFTDDDCRVDPGWPTT